MYEQSYPAHEPFLEETLSRVPLYDLIIFEPGEVAAPTDLKMTIVPETPTNENPIHTTSACDFAHTTQAQSIIESLGDDLEAEAQFPHWIQDNPDSLQKFNSYIDLKDRIHGNPRDRLLQAAQTSLIARQLIPARNTEPMPEVALINTDSGERTTVKLDVVELITQHPDLLEETRTASQVDLGHESGERKVWLRLYEHLLQQAERIGAAPNKSMAFIGNFEGTASQSLHRATGFAHHPILSEWWELHDGQEAYGVHFGMEDPAFRLTHLQDTLRRTITELRVIRGVMSGNDYTLPIELSKAPDFDPSLLRLKERVEGRGGRLAMLAVSDGVTFGIVSPTPAGQNYATNDLRHDLKFTDLGTHESLAVALKRANITIDFIS